MCVSVKLTLDSLTDLFNSIIRWERERGIWVTMLMACHPLFIAVTPTTDFSKPAVGSTINPVSLNEAPPPVTPLTPRRPSLIHAKGCVEVTDISLNRPISDPTLVDFVKLFDEWGSLKPMPLKAHTIWTCEVSLCQYVAL